MRLRLALNVLSMLGLAGTSATVGARPLIDRHGEALKIATGGEGVRDSLEVAAADRGLDISGATHVVVMDPDGEMVEGKIAGTPPVNPEFPAAGAEA